MNTEHESFANLGRGSKQDSVNCIGSLNDQLRVYVLADGVSCCADGGLAARLVTDKVAELIAGNIGRELSKSGSIEDTITSFNDRDVVYKKLIGPALELRYHEASSQPYTWLDVNNQEWEILSNGGRYIRPKAQGEIFHGSKFSGINGYEYWDALNMKQKDRDYSERESFDHIEPSATMELLYLFEDPNTKQRYAGLIGLGDSKALILLSNENGTEIAHSSTKDFGPTVHHTLYFNLARDSESRVDFAHVHGLGWKKKIVEDCFNTWAGNIPEDACLDAFLSSDDNFVVRRLSEIEGWVKKNNDNKEYEPKRLTNAPIWTETLKKQIEKHGNNYRGISSEYYEKRDLDDDTSMIGVRWLEREKSGDT